MKNNRLTAIIIAFCMMLSMAAYAEAETNASASTVAATQIFAFDDYEDYADNEAMYTKWNNSTGSNVSKSTLVTSDGNKVMELAASSGYRLQSYVGNSQINDMTSVILGFSVCINEFGDNGVYAIVSTASKQGRPFEITESGILKVGNYNTQLELSKGKWYDLAFEYCTSDGNVKAHVIGENVDSTYVGGPNKFVDVSNKNRATFVIDKLASGSTSVYVDNFYMYGVNGNTSSLFEGTYYDFEDFAGSTVDEYNGISVGNADYISFSDYKSDEYGTSLKIDTIAIDVTNNNKKVYPLVRIPFGADNAVTSDSGSYVIEFDYKASSTSKINFCLYGNAAEKNGVQYRLKSVAASELSQMLHDSWYHYIIEFNLDSYKYELTVQAPDGTKLLDKAEYDIPTDKSYGNIIKATHFQLFSDSCTTTDYIDNIYIRPANEPAVFSGSTLLTDVIPKCENNVKFAFSGDIASNLNNCSFKLDTVTVSPVIYGNTAFITIPNAKAGDFHFAEAFAVDSAGNPLYAAKAVRVIDDYSISGFAYSETADNTVASKANIVSNTYKLSTAVLITAVYDSTGKTLLALNSHDVSLNEGEAKALATSVSIPNGYAKDNIISLSFIWKSTSRDITPLCQPLPMK